MHPSAFPFLINSLTKGPETMNDRNRQSQVLSTVRRKTTTKMASASLLVKISIRYHP